MSKKKDVCPKKLERSLCARFFVDQANNFFRLFEIETKIADVMLPVTDKRSRHAFSRTNLSMATTKLEASIFELPRRALRALLRTYSR